jgi:hypothetical protein
MRERVEGRVQEGEKKMENGERKQDEEREKDM